jgi:hypothetical protein
MFTISRIARLCSASDGLVYSTVDVSWHPMIATVQSDIPAMIDGDTKQRRRGRRTELTATGQKGNGPTPYGVFGRTGGNGGRKCPQKLRGDEFYPAPRTGQDELEIAATRIVDDHL